MVLNNHLPGAVCAMVALWAAVRIWFDGERRLAVFRPRWGCSARSGGRRAAGGCRWPPLWAWPCSGRPRGRRCWAWLPAWLLVAAGFFGTNWIAHHSLRPAYMHAAADGDNWYDYTYEHNGRVMESYWKHPEGVDRGEPSPGVYALHVLVGHHGIFSLTPIWLLSVAGTLVWLFQRRDRRLRELALLIGGSLAGLRGVLHLRRRSGQAELRRRDLRLPLGVLARAAVAGGHASGGRLPGPPRWTMLLAACCCLTSRWCRSAIRPGIPGPIPG